MENSALACARPRPHAKAVYNERRELMLARRTIAMDDYVAELNEDKNVVAQRLKRQLGVDYVPIPVPLEPGDTEEEYERRFMEQHSGYRTSGGDTSGSGERAARFFFARRLAKEYVARTKRRAVDQRTSDSTGSSCTTADATSSTPPSSEKRELTVEASERSSSPCQKQERAQAVAGRLEPPASGDVRDTRLYVELDQYRRDYKAGVFAEYKAMTRQQKITRFGIPVVPIFVPLTRGESPQQYEDRFADWLYANYKTTPGEIYYSTKNRWLRMNFAMQNGKGVESFDLARLLKRKRVDDDRNVLPEPSKKRVCQDEEKASVSTQVCSAKDLTSLEACTKCRCDACLLRGMKLLSEKISKMGSHAKCSCAKPIAKRPQDVVVLDLTLDEDEDVEAPQTQRISPPQLPTREALERMLKMDTDDVEEKLQCDYDRLNEQIILNQEALDASVAELASDPPVDIQEMTQLHEENEEVRGLIEAECINRTQVLALLVLYQWRNDPHGLERMLHDDRVNDVVHVQQLSHRKCVAHASAFAVAREQCASLQQQITDSRRAVDGKASSTQQLDEELTVARSRLQELQYQRRYECVVLVHFDQKLRQLLQALLRRIES